MKILFVCEYNACRSQIAEGIARNILPKDIEVKSAGLYPGEVNTLTIEIMHEIGIDISSHFSKRLDDLLDKQFDLLVILAEPAESDCMKKLEAQKIHRWFYPDPAKASDCKIIKQQLRAFRDVISVRIGDLFKEGM